MKFINFGQLSSALRPIKRGMDSSGSIKTIYDKAEMQDIYPATDFDVVASRYSLAHADEFLWGSSTWGNNQTKVGK
jgi:hypothetical protein